MPLGEGFYKDEKNKFVCKEEKSSMEIREKIDQLTEEIKTYKTAQRDASDALSSAEMELDEILDEEYRNSNKE
jgi:cell fate (sporulation/competence/biofilm development) regulator YmcA (YheA/YmcA/DUF963 family)